MEEDIIGSELNNAHIVSQSLLFTSGITLVGHAESWKLPLCEKEAQK